MRNLCKINGHCSDAGAFIQIKTPPHIDTHMELKNVDDVDDDDFLRLLVMN